jgi:hypothetical protein
MTLQNRLVLWNRFWIAMRARKWGAARDILVELERVGTSTPCE